MKLTSLLAAMCSLAILISGCAKKEESPAAEKQETAPAVADVTELKIEDTKLGTGAVAEAGKSVTVHLSRRRHRDVCCKRQQRLVELGSVG